MKNAIRGTVALTVLSAFACVGICADNPSAAIEEKVLAPHAIKAEGGSPEFAFDVLETPLHDLSGDVGGSWHPPCPSLRGRDSSCCGRLSS